MRRALVCVWLTGCMPSVVQSALVATDDMSARYAVVTAGDGTNRATAEFRWVSGMAEVVLDDGDRVLVDGAPVSTRTEFSQVYESNVTMAPEHVFVLQRGTQSIEHRVVSPPRFAITSAPFSGTYDLEGTLTWAPIRADSTVRIFALTTSTGCTSVTLADARADTGSFAFTGADVRPTTEAGVLPPACAYTLEITRTESVAGDPTGLASVRLAGSHQESTTLTLR